MEMERIVNNKLNLILIFFFLTINSITAQHQISKDITFIGKVGDKFFNLGPFLTYFKYGNPELCENRSGVVKFEVSPKGGIISVTVEGNLPTDLVEGIKTRILLTENNWVLRDYLAEKGKNITFYMPVYLTQSQKCKFKVHETYNVMKSFFLKFSILPIDDNLYIMEPIYIPASIS
jgi:hypothetical protein